jgi:hypothetical protein
MTSFTDVLLSLTVVVVVMDTIPCSSTALKVVSAQFLLNAQQLRISRPPRALPWGLLIVRHHDRLNLGADAGEPLEITFDEGDFSFAGDRHGCWSLFVAHGPSTWAGVAVGTSRAVALAFALVARRQPRQTLRRCGPRRAAVRPTCRVKVRPTVRRP